MEKYNNIIKKIYTVCGLFGFVAYFSYFVKVLIWKETTLALAVAIMGMIFAGVPVFFRKFFETKLPRKLFKFLENLFAYGMLFYTVTFVVLAVFVMSASYLQTDVEDLPDDTVFIVYGAGLNGDKPGAVLKKRLDKTVEYMEKLPDSVCIVSGRKGENEIVSEASAMRGYLIEAGIDGSRILLEENAKNTIQNISYSYKLLEKEGLSGRTVVSVSNAFHIPRIKLICQRNGYDSLFVLAKDPNPFAMYTALVREYMSYTKLFIFGTE